MLKKITQIAFLIANLTFAHYTFADSYNNGINQSQMEYRNNCRALSKNLANTAYEYGKVLNDIMTNTKPKSSERSAALDEFKRILDGMAENYRASSLNDRQSNDPSKMLWGTAVNLMPYLIGEITTQNPGKSESWYQDKMFTECTSVMKQ
jgi:hypothetical protein